MTAIIQTCLASAESDTAMLISDLVILALCLLRKNDHKAYSKSKLNFH